MNVNEVIELGKKATEDNFHLFTGYAWWWYLIGALIIAGIVFGIAITEGELASCSFLALLFWCLLSLLFVVIKEDIFESEKIEVWKSDVANPYIESLPVEKKEVLFIKIDPELGTNVNGNLFYTYSTPIQLTPLAVSFKDNGVPTITQWVETHMKLTDEEKPYIEFQRLTKNLGHGIKKGYYNVKIYLPESYEFTDIK